MSVKAARKRPVRTVTSGSAPATRFEPLDAVPFRLRSLIAAMVRSICDAPLLHVGGRRRSFPAEDTEADTRIRMFVSGFNIANSRVPPFKS
ncbi:hypothetical protein ACQ86E_24550 [Bradyrhizobium betae]|uniref:hypothetical protein n=1 Tax=Bradyrhizobium betae TaxID=244734 RepID=UPI003D66C19B